MLQTLKFRAVAFPAGKSVPSLSGIEQIEACIKNPIEMSPFDFRLTRRDGNLSEWPNQYTGSLGETGCKTGEICLL